MGVPKSARARMNTSRLLARMVGMTNGIIRLKKRFTPLHPRLRLASIKDWSMFFRAPDTYRNTSG